MLKIRPLNRDSLSDEDAPIIRKEAQEEIALNLYNNALRLLYDDKVEDSEKILQQLLSENIPQLESQGGLPKTMSSLKYSCYTNLGGIAKQKGNLAIALENYVSASELDKTDVTLWYKIGNLSIQLNKFRQASFAFSQGLQCIESHWPCLDKLIVLLFAIGDTLECLSYITKALILNPDYLRGLVLRKQIYKANPATRDYYKLYNPDYILEPSLDIKISEKEENKCMEDVDKLIERIHEVEKALESQPLPCIPLPTGLEQFTWVALGHTITELHKYISENNMSHFCTVDLTTCMNNHLIEQPEVVEAVEKIETVERIEIDKTEAKVDSDSEKKLEPEQSNERRMSMNSENNADVNDSGVENVNSSHAEDNDEMDQDTEDQEENSEQKSDKKRATKRRRDLLLDLQIWGWHSKRKSVKKGKYEKDLSLEDALKRIIPSHLLPNGLAMKRKNIGEDSMNTADMYQLFNERVHCLSPIRSPNSADYKEEYFGSQREKDDVLNFWTKQWECCDAVSLIQEFVYVLASLWNIKWPSKLIPIYLEAYNMFREYAEHPQVISSEIPFDELKNDALATLLYGELLLYQTDSSETDTIHPMSLGYLQLVSALEENWGDDFETFYLRVRWLRAHIFRKTNDNALAIHFLQLIEDTLQLLEKKSGQKYELYLHNSEKYPFISISITQRLLRHLEMIDSLSRLDQLFHSKHYTEVAEILKTTFVCIGGPPTCGRMGRPAQLGMLMDSLWYTDQKECFIWTEKCLRETVEHFIKPQKERLKWELVLKKCLEILNLIIKEETVSIVDVLSTENRQLLIQSLCQIACHQLKVEGASSIPLGTVAPWIVLHSVLVREEHREQANKSISHVRKKNKPNFEQDLSDLEQRPIPPSIAVLFSAHEFLGQKSWCLTSQGELLHFIIDKVLDRLDTPILEPLRNKIDIHIEQAFFCLYQHPSKKHKVSRHLADHNVNPLPLVWERAQQLYEFYCPDHLPEFDSYKAISITSDLEQLLQRIIVLVPQECDPQPLVPKVSEFVNGNSKELPDSIDFSNKTRAVYYLLGDYYFKQNEVTRSVKYFLLDLCINPMRLDTWADLALGINSQLESKLNHCERFKTESEFLEKAKSVRACFQRALEIVPTHITLWIEFGAFEYMVHSYCSRLLKYESDTFNMEKFEILENEKETYLDGSGRSFLKALDLHQSEQTEVDERWLHHYMLGKVAEKRKTEPNEYLQHYLTAAALLNENNATYPDKINYHNPQHLAIEALEIHYRIHASILKYLELHEGKTISNCTGKIFKKSLDQSKLYETTTKVPEATPSKEEKNIDSSKDDYSEIVKCVEDLLDQVEQKENAGTQRASPMETDADRVAPKPSVNERNVQDIMDAMMKETMANQQPPPDTDSDVTNVDVEEKITNTNRIEEPFKKSENDVENIRKSVDETTESSTSSDSSSSDSDSEDSSSSTSSTSSDVSTTHLSETEVANLVDRCVVGLEQCIIRFPQNYKALYRLAHLYFHYKHRKDIVKCRQLLLTEYKCKNSKTVSGLFSDHKIHNFFNGVWRIPSSEIDRPGSLAAHMARCVTLLLQVLRQNNDHKMLLDVCLQLRRTPDADKIYIRHAEREQLSEQSLSLCIQSLKSQTKSPWSPEGAHKLLIDIFRSYQRVQKHIPQKESLFSSMLCEVYKKSLNDKVPDTANVLDMAIKFCQLQKSAEKVKVQQQKQNLPPPTPPLISGTPVVLPTPSTATVTSTAQPLKRPTLGRPRGRPPGPKFPGVNRPRAKNLATNSMAWQNMMYDQKSMNYILKYQEELLRQYNTINKMKQNYQAQFAAFTSQPASMASAQALQNFNQIMNSGLNPVTMPNLSNINPALLKKLIEQCSTPNQSWSSSLFNQVTTKAKTSSKPSATQPKATYTTAGFNKNFPSTSSTKFNSIDISRSKPQTVTLEENKKFSNQILNQRPNLTITPVSQDVGLSKLPTHSPTGKTLQEKLADKQKQLTFIKNNEQGKSQLSSTFSSPIPSSSISHVKIPSFPLDSGISISQLPSVTIQTSQRGQDFGNQKSTTSKKKAASQLNLLPQNIPVSVSVIKKPDETVVDDDVIVIE